MLLFGDRSACDGPIAFELTVIALTLPLWIFLTLYLLLLLVHYVRSIQYFSLYDKCQPKNSHFRYDFHLIIGKYSSNYNVAESNLFIDMLDDHVVSTMSIQIPGHTMFFDKQVFMYRRSRKNSRCVRFSIYRKYPMREVKSIRIAHGCSNQDSRIFVYGVNIHDTTNNENKFFPITSLVKYRGTQWALTTTFEPKVDMSFSKLGCDCHDPFGVTSCPTYMETLTFIGFICACVFALGYLMPVSSVGNIGFHFLAVLAAIGAVSGLVVFVYLKLIKSHVVDSHFESTFWCVIKSSLLGIICCSSLALWIYSLGKIQVCKQEAEDWFLSSVLTVIILSGTYGIIYFVFRRSGRASNDKAMEETENALLKTNSKPNLDFIQEAGLTLFSSPKEKRSINNTIANSTNKMSKGSRDTTKGLKNAKEPKKKGETKKKEGSGQTKEYDTADNTNDPTVYIKTKNRNSISQYV